MSIGADRTPQESDTSRAQPPRVSLQPWTRQMDAYTGPDTLLDFNQVDNVCIDLTEANSSGQAQLLMGRPTRLSTIVHDPEAYGHAVRAARSLRTKTHELSVNHGLDAAYLAAGTASWLARPRGSDPTGAGQRRWIAPVLLAPLALKPRPDLDDFELQLVGPARLNPAMVRRLAADHGVDLTSGELARLAYGTRRLDPAPALETLRTLAGAVPGMHVEHKLLVSTFADLHDRPADLSVVARTAVVRDLARLKDSAVGRIPQVEEITDDAPPLDQRHPADELLLLDADGPQQEVLDLAAQGHSFVVTAAPGTGQLDTAVNTVGTLVAAGRTVLVLGERRTTLAAFGRRMDGLGLGTAVLPLSSQLSDADVAQQLVRAVARNERAERPDLAELHETLRTSRDQLAEHVRSLHTVRPRWSVSPYRAVQALAELTSRRPAPATAVRFPRSVLDAVTERGDAVARLERAAELGAFDAGTLAGPWTGARLVNEDEARQAHRLAQSLLLELTTLETGMRHVLATSGLRGGTTVPEWGRQLRLLQEVQDSLTRFTPDIYDRPVTDLVAATAGSGWRREHGIEMTGLQRSRLRKAAKEYIRHGVHLSDLHAALLRVQSERERWREWATSSTHPVVSERVEELAAVQARFVEDLEGLAIALEGSSTGADLLGLPIDRLRETLDGLINDEENLAVLPERTVLLDELRGQGLGELVDDLVRRTVPRAEVPGEFDLAWWQSTLEAMITGDDFLAMPEGHTLRKVESVFRRADAAHVASGAGRLLWELADRWQRTVRRSPRAAAALRRMLRAGAAPLEEVSASAGELIGSLVPVWTASPLVLSAALPEDHDFDAVVVLDAESSPLAAVLPALTRCRQVIAFGDPHLGRPQPFTVAPTAVPAPGAQPVVEVDSAFDALSRVVPERTLRTVYRSMDEQVFRHLNEQFYGGRLSRLPHGESVTGATPVLDVEYVPDGVGALTAGIEGIQAPAAEVRRVVELVFEHAARHPRRSLAVVTASAVHAARIAQSVRQRMREEPAAAAFFAPGPESFRVVDLHRAAGIVRDTVIFSLGFGKTANGRTVPYLGALSERHGRQHFVLGMTRARHSTRIVTSLHPGEMEGKGLQHGARDFARVLAAHLGGPPPGEEKARDTHDDALVVDLARRLVERGASVRLDYAGVLDLVAWACTESLSAGAVVPGRARAEDRPLRIPVAGQSDGSPENAALSVRERSRLRPQQLERTGWNYLTLWTIEVFTDPDTVAELIRRYLGLPAAPQRGDRAG
ncbi:hypothetical protein RF644_15470 [Kocuria sp. CPCC 205258]|uniref:hypothetical protein n=1 Tax=Kocuria sp. CPCC 205258 TaxID=3073552 RepID=UPI0034D62C7D